MDYYRLFALDTSSTYGMAFWQIKAILLVRPESCAIIESKYSSQSERDPIVSAAPKHL